ncbi:hypothetical protein LCGC14_1243620 [marine sediment metagenome]|uniref:Uncharacterized protein n=1 Tax=marine sediment metagenome TaxID=412755 RepID=A0A0F9L914_9ZZZZ
MTRRGSADVGFLLSGGRDLLGTTTTLDIKREAETEETTVLGVGDEEHAATGLKSGASPRRAFSTTTPTRAMTRWSGWPSGR